MGWREFKEFVRQLKAWQSLSFCQGREGLGRPMLSTRCCRPASGAESGPLAPLMETDRPA
jgi:hypothetical protein